MGRRSDIYGVNDATGMIFAVGAITITEVATAIPTKNLDNRKALTIFNMSTSEWVYLGNADVTSVTGYPLTPNQGLPFDLSSGAKVYGICPAGKTAVVRYLEVDNG